MKVNTSFGEQDVAPEEILTFPQGLPGFDNLTRFKLFHEEGNSSLHWLQSLDDPQMRFPATDPALLKVQYEIRLSDEEMALLGDGGPEDIALLVLLYRGNRGETGEPTQEDPLNANFLGPLIINTRSRTGMQKVLNQVEDYVTIRAQ